MQPRSVGKAGACPRFPDPRGEGLGAGWPTYAAADSRLGLALTNSRASAAGRAGTRKHRGEHEERQRKRKPLREEADRSSAGHRTADAASRAIIEAPADPAGRAADGAKPARHEGHRERRPGSRSSVRPQSSGKKTIRRRQSRKHATRTISRPSSSAVMHCLLGQRRDRGTGCIGDRHEELLRASRSAAPKLRTNSV